MAAPILGDPARSAADPHPAHSDLKREAPLWPTSLDQESFRAAMLNGAPTSGFADSLIVQAHDFFRLQIREWIEVSLTDKERAERTHGLDEIAVVGDRADLVAAVQTRYLPGAVLAWGEPYEPPPWQDRPEGFACVCRNFACQSPTTTTEELIAQMEA
ncbi:MAG: hypothetical protein F4017_00980 [Acidimicrobiaceae bacterium]|nr:hypothetical protein [Acidimicrobiaceae bacterium]MYE76193.1 hypothetical protein [Acidimicrobiaceae bacterium]MYH42384.1 hypothetical protein [Acidimicrobiaceae bacterium]MYJ81008.1 hypothetical protein [Acidimicrobiaceae bacterium]MYK73157.1 hypothetical protein [Acidimicrobiaceae bacterium]